MRRIHFIRIAIWIFGIVALLHLLRAIFAWPVIIANWEMPFWLSWLAFVILLWMVIMGLIILHRKK